eukprot:1153994-Pelagomonas_calceolata.AAC.5
MEYRHSRVPGGHWWHRRLSSATNSLIDAVLAPTVCYTTRVILPPVLNMETKSSPGRDASHRVTHAAHSARHKQCTPWCTACLPRHHSFCRAWPLCHACVGCSVPQDVRINSGPCTPHAFLSN